MLNSLDQSDPLSSAGAGGNATGSAASPVAPQAPPEIALGDQTVVEQYFTTVSKLASI